MEEDKYTLAGWLAVAQAALLPVLVVVAIIEGVAAAKLLRNRGLFFGFSDLLMLVSSVLAVYLLLMFRKLLRERYGYHDLDLLIMLSIWCLIMSQAVQIALSVLLWVLWPVDQILFAIVYVVFLTGALVTTGIVDILIAVKLLKVKENFGEYIRGFAYVTMAAGICEVSVLLCPFAFLLMPVSMIILALVFFRDQREVEFV